MATSNTIPYSAQNTTQNYAALHPYYAAQNTVWTGPSIGQTTTNPSPLTNYQIIPLDYEYDVASDSYKRRNPLSANPGIQKPVVQKEEFSEEEISKAEELMRELDSAAQV